MKTRIWRLGGFLAVTFSLAALSGTALADPGNGNGAPPATPPGQENKAEATPPPATPAAPAAPAQGNPSAPGQQKKASSSSTASPSPGQAKQAEKAAAPGVKPSSTTSKSGHWTSCSTGGTASSPTCSGNGPKADGSKQYGNRKTAAQIAVSRGAPDGTKLTGPGNSQPHKVAVCPKKNNKSGGVDVHAVKSYTAVCAQQQSVLLSPRLSAAEARAAAPTFAVSPFATAAGVAPTFAVSPFATAAGVVPTGSAGPAGGVLGAQATLEKPSAKKSAGGVLGAFASLGRTARSGTLPFTGLPLWIATLVGLGLIAGGLAVRAGRATEL